MDAVLKAGLEHTPGCAAIDLNNTKMKTPNSLGLWHRVGCACCSMITVFRERQLIAAEHLKPNIPLKSTTKNILVLRANRRLEQWK